MAPTTSSSSTRASSGASRATVTPRSTYGGVSSNRASVRTTRTQSTSSGTITTTRRIVRTTPAAHGRTVVGATRSYNQAGTRRVVTPARSYDHRYARPNWRVVRYSSRAYSPPPRQRWYRPLYTRWYTHPWYRYQYATSFTVCSFGFTSYAWNEFWVPPHRTGFTWIGPSWVRGVYAPGYWVPQRRAPVGYVYVPGYWDADNYVEGFYRVDRRGDGDWTWVDGYYLDDGTHIRGHWRPAGAGPEGYAWEPGFWDGETWVDGFWRPEFRSGFTWVSSFYDAQGIYNSGYWAPIETTDGFVWVPGWFDGNDWVEGYWVRDDEYENTDLGSWQPEEGWDDGWDLEGGWGDGYMEPLGDGYDVPREAIEELPLGIPVD